MIEPVPGTLIAVGATDRVRTGLTPFAMVALGLSMVAVVAAMASARAELLLLATPLLLAIAVSVAAHAGDRFAATISVDNDRLVEGDIARYNVEVSSSRGIANCAISMQLAPGTAAAAGSTTAIVSVLPGVPRVVQIPVEMREWGIYDPRMLTIRISDAFRMLTRDYRFTVECPVRVAVHDERLRSLAEPDRYRRITGGHLSPDRGDGTELADVREYHTGDPLRWVNWRISNRRREPWVTVRHPDRSTTIVLLVDGYTQGAMKERAVARAAQALAHAHLAIHDQVGLLVLGRSPQWVPPDLGKRQVHRISDTLLDLTSRGSSFEMLDPARVVPRDAVVIAVSALDNPSFVRSLAGLRTRGRSLTVIEPTSPLDELQPSHRIDLKLLDSMRRLYSVEREIYRRALRERGLMVISWDRDEPIDVPIGQMRRFQQLTKAVF